MYSRANQMPGLTREPQVCGGKIQTREACVSKHGIPEGTSL